MSAVMRNERGSAVIIAVMAMLIMGVLSISFALLADIESRVGVSYKQQAQAEALAEAALERARDAVRTAPTTPGGFTSWLSGPSANHNLFSAQSLNGGQYWARIDNDCAAFNTVPVAIQEPTHPPGATPCDNTTDYNEVAVITAWAVSSQGRSRARAIVGVDNPWKHVCSNARPDNNGYCNEPGNRNGNPTVQPSDPNDPNGPQAYNDLPRPMLGCSRIDPLLHRGAIPPGNQTNGCLANGQMYSYPYPVAFNAAPRFVMMGEDPAVNPAARKCNVDPVNPAIYYFGYFDCALSTPCDPALGHICPGGTLRRACVVAGDSRLVSQPSRYVAAPGCSYTSLPTPSTGMAFSGNTNFGTNVGAQGKQFMVYVHNGNWTQANNVQFYGTLAVEGTAAGGTIFQVGNGANSDLWAGMASGPAVPAGWADCNLPSPPVTPANCSYGYPLIGLIYNPAAAPPTIQPTYLPQNHTADFGSNNTEIHGMIYSGGHVQFNPLTLDGTVVAFEIQTQGSATYTYNGWYGNNSPPPGFPFGSGNQVVIIRKSFVVCTNFNDDGVAPTACN